MSSWSSEHLVKYRAEATTSYMDSEKLAEDQTERLVRERQSNKSGEYFCTALENHFPGFVVVRHFPQSMLHQREVPERITQNWLVLMRFIPQERNNVRCFLNRSPFTCRMYEKQSDN